MPREAQLFKHEQNYAGLRNILVRSSVKAEIFKNKNYKKQQQQQNPQRTNKQKNPNPTHESMRERTGTERK